MAKTKELEIHDTAHNEEINKRIKEVQKRRSAEKQAISSQEEKIIDKMTKPYQEKIVNPDEVLIGPAGIYDPSKKQDDPLLDISQKVKEGLKEYSQTNLADVLIGPAGYGPGHPKYEGPKKGEKKPKDEIYLGPAGYGPGHPKYEGPKKGEKKPKDEIYLGPAGYGPGHPKYEGPKSEQTTTENNEYNTLFDKLKEHGKVFENNKDVEEIINTIQNPNASER